MGSGKESIAFGLCPCQLKNLSKWESLSSSLSEFFGAPVEIKIFEDLVEEEKAVEEATCPLYLTSADTAISLWDRGYTPVAEVVPDF